jgi:hypothetical protein
MVAHLTSNQKGSVRDRYSARSYGTVLDFLLTWHVQGTLKNQMQLEGNSQRMLSEVAPCR